MKREPYVPEHLRREMVEALKPVDRAVLGSTTDICDVATVAGAAGASPSATTNSWNEQEVEERALCGVPVHVLRLPSRPHGPARGRAGSSNGSSTRARSGAPAHEMKRIGLADTTFARVDMACYALDALRAADWPFGGATDRPRDRGRCRGRSVAPPKAGALAAGSASRA